MVTGSSSSSALAVGLAAVLALSAATSTAEGAHLGMVGSRRSVGPYSTLQLHARQYGADAPGQRQSTGSWLRMLAEIRHPLFTACASLCIRTKIEEAADPGLATCEFRCAAHDLTPY